MDLHYVITYRNYYMFQSFKMLLGYSMDKATAILFLPHQSWHLL